MRINMVGGVLTMPYNLAKHLRNKNIDVRLFVDTSLDISFSPAWEDEELNKDGFPDWIERHNANLFRFCLGFSYERKFLRQLSNCDLIHAHGESCIWAAFTKKPYVFQSYGFDLDSLPFKKTSPKMRILSYLQRRSIKKASEILLLPYQIDALKRIDNSSNNKYVYQYWGVDTDKYKKVNTPLHKIIRKKYNVELVCFHPTRHEWGNANKIDKGNDKLIMAISKYVKLTSKKVLFVFIEKGNDVNKSKKMINDLCLQKNILWLKPMNKNKLIEYFSISDIVFDQFEVLGALGQICLESMSVGVPTFLRLRKDEIYFAEVPPVVDVYSIDEIVHEMVRLTNDTDMRIEIGNKSREYILKFFDWDVVIKKYIKLYQKYLNKDLSQKI